MRIITLLCAILWAMTTLFSIYNLTVGSYPFIDLFLKSPIDALRTGLWFLTKIATTAFFFVLWLRQT